MKANSSVFHYVFCPSPHCISRSQFYWRLGGLKKPSEVAPHIFRSVQIVSNSGNNTVFYQLYRLRIPIVRSGYLAKVFNKSPILKETLESDKIIFLMSNTCKVCPRWPETRSISIVNFLYNWLICMFSFCSSI